jgi:hypothetical protein
MDMTRIAVLAALLAATACDKRNTDSPNIIEQTADDVGSEVDGAGDSVDDATEDVGETVTSAVGND